MNKKFGLVISELPDKVAVEIVRLAESEERVTLVFDRTTGKYSLEGKMTGLPHKEVRHIGPALHGAFKRINMILNGVPPKGENGSQDDSGYDPFSEGLLEF